MAEDPIHCPACDSEDLQVDTDFASGFCRACGYVVSSETKEPVPGEVIENPDSDSSTHPFNESWTEHVEIRESSDAVLVEFIEKCDMVGRDVLVPPKNRSHTGKLAKQAWIEGFLHGRSIDTVAGAIVFVACRVIGEARPASTVAEAASVDTSSMSATVDELVRVLDIDLPTPQPVDYLQFIYDWFERPADSESPAFARLQRLEKIPPGNPAGIAAAAIYLEFQNGENPVTYREVAEPVGLTKETIWRHSDCLRRHEL